MPNVHSQKPVVLIVDDEPDILDSLEVLIETEVPEVHVAKASSGPAALAVMKKDPVRLIISDYRMPGMDGFAFLSEAQRLQPGVPTIMMTAYPDPRLAARAVDELGVGLFIAKPFDLNYLVSVVKSLTLGAGRKGSVPKA